MAIQSSINQTIATVAGAVVAGKHLKQQKEANEMRLAEMADKEVELGSQINDLENKATEALAEKNMLQNKVDEQHESWKEQVENESDPNLKDYLIQQEPSYADNEDLMKADQAYITLNNKIEAMRQRQTVLQNILNKHKGGNK